MHDPIRPRGRTLPPSTVYLLALAAVGSSALACAFAPGGNSGTGLTSMNAVWNCPTSTPIPPPTPIPVVCATGTPDANGTPGPQECGKAIPTWTPLPSPTPYGRWMNPGPGGTTTSFYAGQDVRVGSLRITLTGYSRSALLPGAAGQVAHIFTLDTRNEGATALDVQWPVQTFIREIALTDTTLTGIWWSGNAADDAAGLPHWTPSMGLYQPGQQRTITVAIAGPDGGAHALGFVPDPVGGQSRPELGQAANILWFLPEGDPHCDGNTSGPPRQGDGGAVYPQPLPAPPTSQFGYFAGWPVLSNGQTRLTQAFGCTDFHELSGFDCPNARPWYHSGIDLADPSRPLELSVVHGRVIFVGPSAGRACDFPGAEDPKTNLGWMIELLVLDARGHVGPYHVKYGHTQVGSEQVQVGDEVFPGQVLARMASTGCSTGAHLHFMVQDETGMFLDPFNFIGSAPRK